MFRYKSNYHNNIGIKQDPLSLSSLIMPLFFTLFALFFLLLSTWFYNKIKHLQEVGIKTPGRVVDVYQTTSNSTDRKTRQKIYWHSKISFADLSGREQIIEDSNKLLLGQSVEIIYDPQEPNSARVNKPGDLEFAYWFRIVSAVCLWFAALWLLVRIYKQMTLKQLVKSGSKVTARIANLDTRVISKTNMMGFQPFWGAYKFDSEITMSKVVAEWHNPKTNQTLQFVSHHFPGRDIEDPVGKEISVYVNPSVPGKYYVDLSSMRRS